MLCQKSYDQQNFHRKERVFGSATRSLRLPPNVDSSKMTAKFEGGVLRVDLPKVAGAQETRGTSINIS
jgi:HSP20 family protein